MYKICTVILLLFANTVVAQSPPAGAWLSVQLPVAINRHWQWHNDAGYRMALPDVFAQQYLYRTGIRYKINAQWSAAAGGALFYTRAVQQKAATEFGREKRTWQELRFENKGLYKLIFSHRLRSEQRFFDAVGGIAAFNAFRLRYRLQVTQPLNKEWALWSANEYMYQHAHSDWHFDQNRVLLTLQRKLGPGWLAEAGYLWLHRTGQSQHLLNINIQRTIHLHGNHHQNGKE
jgi:hypothetical protein